MRGKADKSGRSSGGPSGRSAFLSGDTRFTWLDLLLIVLAMVFLVGMTWRLLVLSPDRESGTAEITVRFRITGIQDGAEGKILMDELLYTDTGEPLGPVTGIAYLRPNGVTALAYVELRLEAKKVLGGYDVSLGGEGGELFLSIGQEYALHTRNYGAVARCVSITENTNS